MVLVFILYFDLVFTRVFRLKHPKENLFVGGPDFFPFFIQKESSSVFEEKADEENPGRILITVKDTENKVWDIDSSRTDLIYYPKHGGNNQLFSVIHIARDVVAIESLLGGCLQYVENSNRFQLKECQFEEKFRDQTFLITNDAGVWEGKGNLMAGWGTPGEENIKWGICNKCIPGGFGSEIQGDMFDTSLAANIAVNNPNKNSTSEENINGGQGRTMGFKAGSWYGAGGGGGGVGLSQKGESYNNNDFSFSKKISSLEKNSKSIGSMMDGIMKATETPQFGFNGKFSGSLDGFIGNYKNFKENKNMNSIADSEYDSFGNRLTSPDHKLDMKFNGLSTMEKNGLLEKSAVSNMKDDGMFFSLKNRPHSSTFFKKFISDFKNRF